MIPTREPWGRKSAAPRPVRIVGLVMVVDALLLITHVRHRGDYKLDLDDSRFRPLRSSVLWNDGIDGSLTELFGAS